MKNKELIERAQNRIRSAEIKLDAAQSCIARGQFNSAAEWIDQSVEKVKDAKAFVGRIGEDND
jgi:hypothetical protein